MRWSELRSRYSGTRSRVYSNSTRLSLRSDLSTIGGWYILAKVLETFDKQIFDASGHALSGHTLKHLAATMALYWLLRMVQKRWLLGEA